MGVRVAESTPDLEEHFKVLKRTIRYEMRELKTLLEKLVAEEVRHQIDRVVASITDCQNKGESLDWDVLKHKLKQNV